MMKTRKKKQIDIFWFVGAGNEPTRKNIEFVVTNVRGGVGNYLDVNPAIQLLAIIELSAIQ